MSARRPATARPRERGIAMLLVLVGLAVLALVANEVRYNSVVELRLAANQRDELRAHYLAKSGIGLARLMLHFQKQLDAIQLPNLSGLLGGLLGAQGGAQPQGATAQTMSIQLWRMAKIDCHMLSAMVVEDDGKTPPGLAPIKSSKKFAFDDEMPELASAQSKRSFGTFTGCFDTVITDEEERINLNKLDSPQLT
ncbi:MAG: general secretion pathway protein GspK, partial [Archangium sp.]|nr:general secretion pathway protein GspK [Archangium sp.]